MSALAERLELVRQKISDACRRANRAPNAVTLVAVSKTHPIATLQEAISYGQIHFGENRVEEAAGKIEAMGRGVVWHMIGHIQSRKAKDVLSLFEYVHSLDSSKLAERFSRLIGEGQGNWQPLHIFLEINVSGELSKSGLMAAKWQDNRAVREALWAEVRQIAALPYLQLEGVMTMAPVVEQADQARPVFASLRELRDALAADFPQHSWEHLSMGMTDDYEVAIEEGATMVRIGRAIFGERD
ncbi:MAG: YggS family pyridoxal phosphate-dependent enzyme [Anaerolineae bacterium]